MLKFCFKRWWPLGKQDHGQGEELDGKLNQYTARHPIDVWAKKVYASKKSNAEIVVQVSQIPDK